MSLLRLKRVSLFLSRLYRAHSLLNVQVTSAASRRQSPLSLSPVLFVIINTRIASFSDPNIVLVGVCLGEKEKLKKIEESIVSTASQYPQLVLGQYAHTLIFTAQQARRYHHGLQYS